MRCDCAAGPQGHEAVTMFPPRSSPSPWMFRVVLLLKRLFWILDVELESVPSPPPGAVAAFATVARPCAAIAMVRVCIFIGWFLGFEVDGGRPVRSHPGSTGIRCVGIRAASRAGSLGCEETLIDLAAFSWIDAIHDHPACGSKGKGSGSFWRSIPILPTCPHRSRGVMQAGAVLPKPGRARYEQPRRGRRVE